MAKTASKRTETPAPLIIGFRAVELPYTFRGVPVDLALDWAQKEGKL